MGQTGDLKILNFAKALLLLGVVAFLWARSCVGAIAAEPGAPFYLPWEKPAGAFADASFLLDPPAGKRGPVVARDGHFAFANGERVRFWGINLSGDACFPDSATAVLLADRLAKYGFNLVRFHGMDAFGVGTIFGPKHKDTRRFDPAQLEKIDYLIAQLERRGIYVNLNLHVGRRFMASDGVAQPQWLSFAKYCVIFDPLMIELQKEYARNLLAHRNPHTGKTYAEDPAVVVIELTNENSLLGGWTGGSLKGEQTAPPAGGGWSDIPPFYGEELTRFYNAWLAKRYGSREALERAWADGAREAGPEMLANCDFDKGKEGWTFWTAKDADGAFEVERNGAESGARVEVRKVTGVRWNIMLDQRGLKIRQGEKYAVRFRIRASTPRQATVEVAHTGEYKGYLGKTLEAAPEWKEYEYSFVASDNDDAVRLSFQLGEAPGTIWVDDVHMATAAIAGVRRDENPAAGTVKRLAPEQFGTVTGARFRDEGRFYYETEKAYYETMYALLKKDLGCRALVEGTNHNYGLPCLWAESQLDLVDCHAYWQHPNFPNRPWSRTDWRIGNTAMINEPARNTITGLCRSAFAGKPFTVSEYNHPFPNEYSCESPLLLAAYGALQDWDAIYFYTFGHQWRAKELSGNEVTGYFDVCNEVSKLAQMPAAALLFTRGDVRAAQRLVAVSYDENRIFDSLRESGDPFHLEGRFPPLLPLVHRFRVERYGAPRTTRAADLGFKTPGPRIASDTGELAWSQLAQRPDREGGQPAERNFLTIDAPRIAAAIGWTGGRAIETKAATFEIQTPFTAVSAVSLDGKPLAESARILVTAAARCANTGMKWNAERNSITDQWGSAPILIEPVEGRVVLRHSARALEAVPLDGRGVPVGTPQEISGKDGSFAIELKSNPATVWYALTAKQ